MKICLAGTSSFPFLKDEIEQKCQFLLESFIYFQNWQIPLIKSKKLFILDSGAFTFMQKNAKSQDYERYLEQYAEFIKKYQVEHFMNLDLDYVIGIEKTDILTKKLENLTGRQSIPVFHKKMGLEKYKRMISEYDYIAIGTMSEYKSNYQMLRYLTNLAQKNGCKVHGLGYTRLDGLEKMGFYSVDSTTWNNCSKFGELHIFNGEKIKKIRFKGKRLIYNNEVIRKNFIEWCKFQSHLDV